MGKAIPRGCCGRTMRRPGSRREFLQHRHGMDRLRKILTLVLAGTMLVPSGCRFMHSDRGFDGVVPADVYKKAASDIEYPAESACTQMNADESLASPHPWTIDTKGTPEYWNIS